MVATLTEGTGTDLYAGNTPDAFWRLLIEPRVSEAEWTSAVQAAASVLPPAIASRSKDPGRILSSILGEEIFGQDRLAARSG